MKNLRKADSFRIFIVSLSLAFVLMPLATATPATAAEKLNYRLKWLFNVSVVGDLYADVHGLFAAEGLDVTVKPGGPERDAIKELELGLAQFGVASADQVIRALAKGSPVVVLAQLFQINPLQWIYRASQPPIDDLQDLKGRRIGITYGGNDETIMRTLLAKAGLSERDVQLMSVRYDYTPFYKGKVDVWPVYRNAQGPILADKLAQAGEDVRFFEPARFGIKFVANSVVTSQNMIKTHPETVKKFITALLKGWRASMAAENRQKAIETVQRFDKDTAASILVQQFDITRSLIRPGADTRVGAIDMDGWKQTERIMLDQGQISEAVNVETAIRLQYAE